MFNDHEKKHSVTTSVKAQVFGEITLLEVKEHHHEYTCQHQYDETLSVPEHVDSSHANFDKAWEVCVPTKYFNSKVKKFGKNPSWVFNIDNDARLDAVSETLFNAYKEGTERDVDWDERRNKSTARELLEACKHELFVRDKTGDNGHLFDVNGKPILKKYRLDYIGSGARSGDHDIEKLRTHLETLPEVIEVNVVEIPYYNADRGNRGLEIVYLPSQQWLLNFWHSKPRYFIVEDKIRHEFLEPEYEKFKLAEPKKDNENFDEDDY